MIVSPSRLATVALSFVSTAALAAAPANLPLIAGHRGVAADRPENTLASFKEALAQGADALETDCWLTKDGKIILSHDGDTKRVCGEPGLKIADSTFDDLRKLDAGKWKGEQYAGEKLPSLPELLAIVPADKKVYLEIKCGPEIVPEFVREVRASGLTAEQVVVISFNDPVIPAIKSAAPEWKAYYLYAFKRDPQTKQWTETADAVLARAKELHADGLDLNFAPRVAGPITKAFAEKIRDAGLSLHAWTIDDAEQARKAVALGALSVTTNRCGALRQELEQSATTRPLHAPAAEAAAR